MAALCFFARHAGSSRRVCINITRFAATISSSGVFFGLIAFPKVIDSANLSANDFTQRCDRRVCE